MHMQHEWHELADPKAPTGDMSSLCQAVVFGQAEAASFGKELGTLEADLDF